jgi:cysteine desulfuration protein SufE
MLPERLEEIIEDFKFSEGREKIELLVDFAERMPPLPESLTENHQNMEQVHECMTPVFVKAQLVNGGMHFYFDVPAESPTVRGFAAILAQGLEGTPPDQILNIPNDFYYTMGLNEVLTMQRMRGFDGILAHLKRLAVEAINNEG